MAIDYKFDGREGCVPFSVSGCAVYSLCKPDQSRLQRIKRMTIGDLPSEFQVGLEIAFPHFKLQGIWLCHGKVMIRKVMIRIRQLLRDGDTSAAGFQYHNDKGTHVAMGVSRER